MFSCRYPEIRAKKFIINKSIVIQRFSANFMAEYTNEKVVLPIIDPSVELVFHPTYENNDVHLEKMVYDTHTSRLYIGGVNHLYDVASFDMHVRDHAVTGPRDDSVECSGPPVPCVHPQYATNSHTKAMTIDYDSNKLIECTNLYQGRCRTRNLSNIGKESEVKESVRGIVANDATSSAVVFVGSGPPPNTNPGSSISPVIVGGGEQALYVGTTFTPNGGLREEVPAVSALSLDQARLFNMSREQTFTGSYLKIHSLYRQTYRIDYVKGFSSNGFAYFATRQPKFTGESYPTISKLVRVCTKDPDFYSYTEVPLKCSKNGIDYNLLQDIYLGKPGYDLASSMGLKTEDDVLFGVFSKGEGGTEKNITSKNSALCIYPMSKVERKFFENVRECFKGNTAKNLPWFGSNGKCTSTNYPDSEILCGKDVNNYIGGEIPISSEAILVDRSLMTSVVSSTYMGATIAFIGTSNGVLHKYQITGTTAAANLHPKSAEHKNGQRPHQLHLFGLPLYLP
uniref:Sema domain-containing protein n=1 Tax=Acrobeloides nanus TaxID=290746 RepID=A0A914BYD4_9BILA